MKVQAPNYPKPTEMTLVMGNCARRQLLNKGDDWWVNDRGKLRGPMTETEVRERYKLQDFAR